MVLRIFFLLLSLTTLTTMGSEHEATVLRGNDAFGRKLFQEISKTQKENLICSPISVHAVLSMAFQGAGGTTKDAFSTTLQLPEPEVAAKGYQDVMTRLNSVPNITLHLANKIYLKNDYTLQENFKNAVEKQFLSEVENINFAQTEPAAKSINGWVEKKTNNKIKDLIKSSDLSDDTRLVLINAIYFKGDWLHKFDKSKTKEEPFYLNDKDKVDVQMMSIKKRFRYKLDNDLQAQILELPYTNRDVSMIIILPIERTGLAAVEEKLAGKDLSQILDGAATVEVQVSLPRFKIESTIELNDVLTAMGLGEMFTTKANLTGMISDDEKLMVSKVVQKAFIEVNEEGAEAAAATALIGVGYAMPMRPVEPPKMVVDHPFLATLRVRDQQSNYVQLFTSRVSNPLS